MTKQKVTYEIPHDDSKVDVMPLTSTEVDSLKNNEIPLSQIIEISLIMTEIPKVPTELVSDIFQYAGLYATFSTKADGLMIARDNHMDPESLPLSIPSMHTLHFPPGITISKKCVELIVECSQYDDGYDETYVDSAWSHVVIFKKKETDGEILEEVDRTMIGKNTRPDQIFQHYVKRYYEKDGFAKNIELGDVVKFFLIAECPASKNTPHFVSITAKFPIVVSMP